MQAEQWIPSSTLTGSYLEGLALEGVFMSQVDDYSLCFGGDEFLPFDLAYDYLEDEKAIYELENIYVYYKGFVNSIGQEVWESDRFYIDGVAIIDGKDLRNFWQSRYEGGELYVRNFELCHGKVNGQQFDPSNDPITYDLGVSTYINDDNVYVKRSDIDAIARQYGIPKNNKVFKEKDGSTKNDDNYSNKNTTITRENEGLLVDCIKRKDLINLVDLSKVFAWHHEMTNAEACDWITKVIIEKQLSVYNIVGKTLPEMFPPEKGGDMACEVFNQNWWRHPDKETSVMGRLGFGADDVAIRKVDAQTFFEISEQIIDVSLVEIKKHIGEEDKESPKNKLILLSDAIKEITKIVTNKVDRERLSDEILDDYLFAAEDKKNSFVVEKTADEIYLVDPGEIHKWLDDTLKPLVADSTELNKWKECIGYFDAQYKLDTYKSNQKLGSRKEMKEAMDKIEDESDEKDNKITALQAKLSEQKEGDYGSEENFINDKKSFALLNEPENNPVRPINNLKKKDDWYYVMKSAHTQYLKENSVMHLSKTFFSWIGKNESFCLKNNITVKKRRKGDVQSLNVDWDTEPMDYSRFSKKYSNCFK